MLVRGVRGAEEAVLEIGQLAGRLSCIILRGDYGQERVEPFVVVPARREEARQTGNFEHGVAERVVRHATSLDLSAHRDQSRLARAAPSLIFF